VSASVKFEDRFTAKSRDSMHDHLALKGQLAMIARSCGQDAQAPGELIEGTVIGRD